MGTISLVIPQIGLSDTTEDVKLQNALTTIQAVINGNLDTNNISPTAGITIAQLANGASGLKVVVKSANYAAANGDLVVVTSGAPLTITAPAPVANGRFGVFAQFSMSGASPVTIQAASGTPFWGLGTNGAGVASMLLGAQGAYAVFSSDGTNWYLANGQQDTGWVTPSFSAGFGNDGTSPMAYRVQADKVWFKGRIDNTSGSTTSGGALMFTLPAGARPPATVIFQVGIGSVTAPQVTTSGTVTTLTALNAAAQCYFDGLSFSLT